MNNYPLDEYSASSKTTHIKAGDEIFVYAIYCPITNDPFYVGKTASPQQRLESHVINHPYCRGIAEMDEEYTFTMRIIERWARNQYQASRETYWVLRLLEQGHELTNSIFPSRLPPQWVEWLDSICIARGWVNNKTRNNRVLNLPKYRSGE